jgi:hypothetical protein
MQFSETTMPQFTQLELSSRGLKSMKVNLNNSLASRVTIITSFAIFWSVWETRVRNRFSSPMFLKQLQDILQEEWYKIPLQTVQTLYESIPRRIAAVLKAKGGPTPY